ncbi:glycosyltransferase family 4 protein [Clostridium coskatii]|uniref:2-deoxystreptamine N-acetyl-D-glucosaminyltransferase n=1 Tax=Clostridium coskatii TaxID=1705578 RepID=A0A170NNU8_9CLOT|nr:glycosyltransferase family 4 protein [Clostridium coskatii]OAA94193.1 2-deoxystreptamine N-acetyl-D-glucosaminyltransferase [Clostridium coskatii]OBR95537.1 2-deoxystreptamine N-acetyl-D-glucosaminyltransferase [Clostridium coskatii]
MKRILYLITTQQKDGPGNVLINIVNNINRTKYIPIIAYMYYKKDAIESIKDFVKDDIDIVDLNMKSLFRGWLDFRVIFKIRIIIKKYHIDIIHMHLHRPIIFGTIASGKRCKKIATIHNQEPHQNPSSAFEYVVNKLENYTLKRCDYITTVSKAVKNSIIKCYKLNSNRINVIYNCINENKYSFESINLKQKFNLNRKDVLVASIGRLEPQKGIDCLIEASKILKENGVNNFKVLIIGEGSLEKKLRLLVKDSNLEDLIIFTGYICDINSILDQIDIMVMSSMFEGLGLSLIEAMAHKIPCIGTNVGGIPEVIGNDGIIVDKANPVSLANAIKDLLEDDRKRKNIGERLYNRYNKVFTYKKMISEYESLYDR